MPVNDPEHYFDPYVYPPEFTPEDERIARQEGFIDALERWRWLLGGTLADEGREGIKHRTKAQGFLDLASVGLSASDLGALSDESLHLPLDPDYRAESEFRPPSNPYYRHALSVGLQNRLIDLHNKLDRLGLHFEMSSNEVPLQHRNTFLWACDERAEVSEQLAALGQDIVEIERAIDAGDVKHQDFVEQPNIISDDPEVRRVEDAYREELRQAGIEVEDRDELTIDLRDKRRVDSKVPKLIATQEDGPAHYDETSSEELQSRARPGSTIHSQGSHVRDHEVTLMKERLAELGELLHDMGYTRETSLDDVAPQDRSAWGRVMAERDRIAGDLTELTENIQQVEQELAEERTVFEEEAGYEYADEGDSGDRTPDASYESMEMDGEGGDAMDVDGFEGDMDGFGDMEGW